MLSIVVPLPTLRLNASYVLLHARVLSSTRPARFILVLSHSRSTVPGFHSFVVVSTSSDVLPSLLTRSPQLVSVEPNFLSIPFELVLPNALPYLPRPAVHL